VRAAYRDVLGREAETAGLDYWSNFLATGGTRAQFAQTLLTSAEHRLNVIDSYYRDYLGRTAGPTERQWWLAQVQSGAVALGTIEQSFLGSDEYFAIAQQANGAGAAGAALGASQVATRDSSAMANSLRLDAVASATRSLRGQTATVVTTADAMDRWQKSERARAAALSSVGGDLETPWFSDATPEAVDLTLATRDDGSSSELIDALAETARADERFHDVAVELL
jgi:hypothetical protein